MSTPQPIVVGYDGSNEAELALDWAIDTARRTGAPVHALVVGFAGSEHDYGWLPPDALESVCARAAGALSHVPGSSAEVRDGNVVTTLLEAARDASLLVVGSRGRGQWAGVLIGSVSQHLARHAECAVVTVRPVSARGPSRIVVGVDGSGGSRAALEFACRRAEVTGEPVVAVHGWRLSNVPVDKHGDVPRDVVTRMASRDLLLSESVAGLREKFPDVALSTQSVPVSAGRALADASTTASLVVVGSRGRTAFEGMLLGSVSQDVLQHAHCPVAVVR